MSNQNLVYNEIYIMKSGKKSDNFDYEQKQFSTQGLYAYSPKNKQVKGVSVIVCPPLNKENYGRACWTVALNIDTEINNSYLHVSVSIS